jgi:magnesium transporter
MTSDLDLCRVFADAHPGDAARVLERLPAADVAGLLDTIPPDTCAKVFDQMTAAAAAACLVRMQIDTAAATVKEVRTDLAAALLRRVDGATQSALLERMPEAEASVLRRILRYPEGTAGALMDPSVMAVPDDVSAGEALTRIRRSPDHLLAYLYVVDRTRRRVGACDIRELMLARPALPMSEVMHRPVASLRAHMTRVSILAHQGWSDFHALPVVDDESVLLGAIRYQTFRRLEDEARMGSDGARGNDAVAAVFALGELYWLGLSGLLDGLASAVKRSPSGDGGLAGGDHGTV